MAFASHFASVLSCPQCSPEVTWLDCFSALSVSIFIGVWENWLCLRLFLEGVSLGKYRLLEVRIIQPRSFFWDVPRLK